VTLHSLETLDEIRALRDGTSPLDFTVPSRKDAYGWIGSLCANVSTYASAGPPRASSGIT
jgi:hypothetical protein